MNRRQFLVLTLIALSASALLSTAMSAVILGPGIVRAYWESVASSVGDQALWSQLAISAFASATPWALLSGALMTMVYMASDRRTSVRIRVVRSSSRQRERERFSRVAA